MKRFMLLHYGFEKPTPEIMAAWGKWFESIGPHTVDQGGFHAGGKALSHDGVVDLPLAADSITGYTIIKAEDLAGAEELAADNPFIESIRIYEIVEQ